MRLYQKIALLFLAVTVLAAGGVGLTLTRVSVGALRQELASAQRVTASLVSLQTAASFKDLLNRLARVLSAHPPPSSLAPDEQKGLVSLLYQQWPAFSALALLDGQGRPRVPILHLAQRSTQPSFAEHPLLSDDGVASFLAQVPVTLVSAGQPLALSGAYFQGSDPTPRLALAMYLEPGAILAAEVSVSPLTLPFLAESTLPESARWLLLDQSGQAIWAESGKQAARLPAVRLGQVHPLAAYAQRTAWQGQYRLGDVDLVATTAPVEMLNWLVVIEEPASQVFANAEGMRLQTVLWLLGAGLFAVAVAMYFSYRLKRRLGRYLEGIARFGQGALTERVPETPSDEIGELGRALNHMASDLKASRDEIEAWNNELVRRVEDRTKELREAYAELITQGRMVAVGQLGAGMAHEINNPLSTVIGNAQLLMMKKGQDQPEYPYLKRIDEAAKRCVAIVTGLLRFSQSQQLGWIPDLHVNDLITQVCEAAQGEAKNHQVHLRLDLDANLPSITGDPGEVSQVLLQLLSNAFNAMHGSGGEVTIASRREGEYVVMSVRDHGPGIPPELIERIFDPFFTTKENWRGLGLGLSIVYRIVQDHGGKVKAETHPEGGALVTVHLPLKAQRPEAPAGTQASRVRLTMK